MISAGAYLTLAAIFGIGGLVAALYALPLWMKKKRAQIAILDDNLVFERWMHSEHMYRGENAAERAKRAIALQSQKQKGSLMLAEDESGLSREAKLVAGAYKLFRQWHPSELSLAEAVFWAFVFKTLRL